MRRQTRAVLGLLAGLLSTVGARAATSALKLADVTTNATAPLALAAPTQNTEVSMTWLSDASSLLEGGDSEELIVAAPPTTGSLLEEGEQADWGWQKWLLWPAILYFFWAQSLVCDEYFVPSVQVFAETFHIPDDVAGATVMALGCNGPELFVNVIALFITHSDIGVGTIVGSDVFNLLLICGFSTLCAPGGFLTLDGGRLSRDLFFYMVSIGLLYWAIRDGVIQLVEAIVLSVGVIAFGTTVALWSRLLALCGRGADSGGDQTTTPAAVEEGVPQARSAPVLGDDPAPPSFGSDRDITAFLEKIALGAWLEVRPGGHLGRLQSRWRPFVRRYIRIDEKGNVTMARHAGSPTNSSPDVLGAGGRPVYARRLTAPSELFTTSLTRRRLLTTTTNDDSLPGADSGLHADLQTGDFLGRVTIQRIDIVEVVPAEGPEFRIVCSPPRKGSNVDDVVRPSFRDQPVEWELKAENEEERQKWVEALSGRLKDAMLRPTEREILELVEEHREIVEAAVHGHTRSKTCRQRLWSLVEWFCFPVEFFLEVTVPECHVGSARKKWPITFMMSMAWLGVFSYVLCAMADMVHAQFKISNSLLGLTLTAAGTSFPNLVASILVAKRGQSAMAIANAVGSNIQNVFLALGFPWVAKALCSPNLQFTQSTEGIVEGVFWMAGTLGLFIVLVSVARCGLGRIGAALLVTTYVGFVVYAIVGAS